MSIECEKIAQYLGDSHNFGKRVLLFESNVIYKPRPVLWEFLIFDRNSELRAKIESHFKIIGFRSPFISIPYLAFDTPNPTKFGRVEFLFCSTDISNKLTMSAINWYDIGSFIALMAWLGISDLHSENMIIGRNIDNGLVLAPVDIEAIFDDFELPCQTGLIPSVAINENKCGLNKLFCNIKLINPIEHLATICSGYVTTLATLIALEGYLSSFLIELSKKYNLSSRILFRNTYEYKMPLNDFSSSELEQLGRGDIPYFFRRINDNTPLYYTKPDQEIEANLPSNFIERKNENFRSLGNNGLTPRKHTDKLIKAGALEIVRCFDDSSYEKMTTEHDGISVQIEKATILVNMMGMKIQTWRNTDD